MDPHSRHVPRIYATGCDRMRLWLLCQRVFRGQLNPLDVLFF
jgi:hypothetical protein